jgi:RNA-directed DNA polymerase
MKGHKVVTILKTLNPIIKGWCNYFRTCVSSEVFHRMDNWMFARYYRYARRTHPNKPLKWLRNRYWGKLNKEREDYRVFGDKKTGSYLLKFGWFKIERHRLVKGTSSPDDPELRDYWESRKKVNKLHLTES